MKAISIAAFLFLTGAISCLLVTKLLLRNASGGKLRFPGGFVCGLTAVIFFFTGAISSIPAADLPSFTVSAPAFQPESLELKALELSPPATSFFQFEFGYPIQFQLSCWLPYSAYSFRPAGNTLAFHLDYSPHFVWLPMGDAATGQTPMWDIPGFRAGSAPILKDRAPKFTGKFNFNIGYQF